MSGDSSKLHEMNPRKRRAASHKASRMRCAGTPRPASPLASPATPKRNAQEWQDSRLMHDSRSPRSEKRPFLARSSRGVSSDGDLRGFSDTWRAHLAKASPFPDAWRADLARSWRFSRPRPLSGCMERKTCHGLPPGNAPWRNLVTTSRPRTHFAHILPSPGAWECIASISCHRQTSENAQRRHISVAGRPVAQRSPREGVGSGPWLRCGVRRATLSVRGSGHSAFSGLNCWERSRVCAVSVGNHEPASRSAKLCRIMC